MLQEHTEPRPLRPPPEPQSLSTRSIESYGVKLHLVIDDAQVKVESYQCIYERIYMEVPLSVCTNLRTRAMMCYYKLYRVIWCKNGLREVHDANFLL